MGLNVFVFVTALALRLQSDPASVKPPVVSVGAAPTLPPAPWGAKWGLPYRQEMINTQNTQYAASFMIGPTPIMGIFDTGSFELLVLSERCDHCTNPSYDHTISSTFVPNGTVVQHVFGSGPCLSMKGYEQIAVGPMSEQNVTFYEIVKHEIPVFETASFTAIVGLGDGPGDDDQSLLQVFGVSEFSICLERANNAPGWLSWGGDMTAAQKEKALALPVVGNHHWAVHMTDLGIGGQSATCGQGCAAILDSGTSLIAAPGAALMALSMVLPPINEDCSNLDALPDLVFMLNGHEVALPPEAYVLRLKGTVVEAKSVWDILYFRPKVQKVDQCMPAFMQLDMNSQFGPVWIMGMPFFRFFHTTFHIDEEQRDNRTIFLTSADEKCNPVDLDSDVLEQDETYEAPPAEGSPDHIHTTNMGVLQKNKAVRKEEETKEQDTGSIKLRYHGKRRGKQNPVEVDATHILTGLGSYKYAPGDIKL